MQWTAEWVDEVLTAPDRAIQHALIRVWIARQGGLARVYEQLRAAPLAGPARRLLEALLDDPGAPAATYAARLAMHRSTYQRQRRQLMATLAAFLQRLPAVADQGPAVAATAVPGARNRAAPAGNRLPAPLTPLIGRAAECAALLKRVQDRQSRLVSLIGPGGIGKTRVMLAVAESLRRATPDQVWWVDLTPLDDAAQVLPAIARAVGMLPLPTANLLEALQSHLADEPGYLILDNAEHVLEAGPQLGQLLHGAGSLTLLVTSRVRLDLYGEQAVPLPPLPLPATAAQVEQPRYRPQGAMELFIQRAEAANPLYPLGPATFPAIYAICRQLDGLPLAIELAAAHLRERSLQEIEAGLADCLNFLDNGPRDVTARQRTLRALLDWSYRLLPPPLQRLFGILGVFHNGWSHELLAAVWDEGEPAALAGQLQELAHYQLVTAQHDPEGRTRYGMLETVRAYAVECLAGHERGDAIHERHAQALLALAAPCRSAHDPAQPAGPFPEDDYRNCVAALAWCFSAGDTERLLELAMALWPWWIDRGDWEEGLAWCVRVLAATAADTGWRRADVLYGAARLSYEWGRTAEAVPWLEEAATLVKAFPERPFLAAEILHWLGIFMGELSRLDAAQAMYSQSLALWQQLDRPIDAARTQHNLGLLARAQGRYPEAIRQFQASLAFFQGIGDAGRCAIILGNLSSALVLQGDFAAGLQRAQAGMELARQVRTPNFLYNLFYLAHALLHNGRHAPAQDLLVEAHALLAESPPIRFVAWLTLIEAMWLTGIGMDEAAITLFGAWTGLHRHMNANDERPREVRWAEALPYLDQLQARVGEPGYAAAWQRGEMMDGAAIMRYCKTLLSTVTLPPDAL